MAKTFAPRVSKRSRNKIDLTEKLGSDLFSASDNKLLKGAKIQDIKLSEINVKEQVRTKFNDNSLRDLGENIKLNGLIQPLVLHKDVVGYRLICGERRFRAMNLIGKIVAPCFVLLGKSEEELMAIQFSENSSREALHYIDKADGILNYQLATNASERKIQAALSLSKSDVHRSLQIAKMSLELREAAKNHDIEKYVLLEFDKVEESEFKENLYEKIRRGDIIKRSQLKKVLNKEIDSISKLSSNLKAAAKKFGINNSVMSEFSSLKKSSLKSKIEAKLLEGRIVSLSDYKRTVKSLSIIRAGKKMTSSRDKTGSPLPPLPNNISAQDFINAINKKFNETEIDERTQKVLSSLISDTQENIELDN